MMTAARHPFLRLGAFLLLAFGLPLCLAGCGGSGGGLVPVKGKVTVDNKALTKGSIAFHPPKGDKSLTKIPSAEIGADGSYELFTDGQRGAPPGKYKVTVTAMTEADSAKAEQAKSLVQEMFTDPTKTPLDAEVSASPKAGAYDFNVMGRK